MRAKFLKLLRKTSIDRFATSFTQIQTLNQSLKMSIPIIFHSLESTFKVLRDEKVIELINHIYLYCN